MKKFIVTSAVAGLVAGSAIANASMTVDIGTAHVFRGTTVADDLVVQPALELSGFGMSEEYGVIAVGAWGSTAPFNDDAVSLDSIYETDWYLNYALPQFVEGMDLYVQYTQYQYSGGLDEKELNFGIGYLLGDFYLGGSANFMLDDRNLGTENQKYVDLYANYDLEINEKSSASFGALMGLMFQGDGNAVVLDDGFNQYELDAAYTYALSDLWSIGASLAYIGQFDSNVLPDVWYDKGLVAFLNLGCDM